ncbi:MAG: hypothetical protein PQJ58_13370 [Spirochaetales bacterium]|nr:hypothetical protein [Spirochaetales bacterium]
MSKENINPEAKDDRLSGLEKKLEQKKRRGHQLYWIKYNPGAEFDYDLTDATEDVRWMIFEIKKLREENEQYREFIASYRKQISEELE